MWDTEGAGPGPLDFPMDLRPCHTERKQAGDLAGEGGQRVYRRAEQATRGRHGGLRRRLWCRGRRHATAFFFFCF